MNKILLLSCALPLFAFAGTAETLTPQVEPLQRFSAEAQISGLEGYDLRARKIVVPAGGKIPEHGHKTRPGIVYVQSGEIIEFRSSQPRLLKAGDSVIEDVNTVHGYENVSTQACVLIAFDIPAQVPQG